MDLPKPSFLRNPVIPEWPQEQEVKKAQSCRLISLKALRKEYQRPVYSSFLSSLSSSSRLTDLPQFQSSTKPSKTESPILMPQFSRMLQPLKATPKRFTKPLSKGIGGVVGKQLFTSHRVTIQIDSTLPRRYALKKSISRSQRTSPR